MNQRGRKFCIYKVLVAMIKVLPHLKVTHLLGNVFYFMSSFLPHFGLGLLIDSLQNNSSIFLLCFESHVNWLFIIVTLPQKKKIKSFLDQMPQTHDTRKILLFRVCPLSQSLFKDRNGIYKHRNGVQSVLIFSQLERARNLGAIDSDLTGLINFLEPAIFNF